MVNNRRRAVHYVPSSEEPVLRMHCDQTPIKQRAGWTPQRGIYVGEGGQLLTDRVGFVTCRLCKDKMQGDTPAAADARQLRAMEGFLAPYKLTPEDVVEGPLWELLADVARLAEKERGPGR